MSKSNQQSLNEYFAQDDNVNVKLCLGDVQNHSAEDVCGYVLDVMEKYDNGELSESPLRNERYGLREKASI